jgi:hypothetical protein
MTEKELMETIVGRLYLVCGAAKDKFRGKSTGNRDYVP